MAKAIAAARRGVLDVHPNPAVGCVLVRDNRIIATGWHRQAGGPHAEVAALQQATESVAGADVYVTLEPCAHTGRTGPCAQALIEAKVGRVFIGHQDPNPLVAGRGIAMLKAAGIAVEVGVLESACRALNVGFISLHERQRVHVTLKSAMSLDGRTALKDGQSHWITGADARADVHQHRAQASVILSSARSVMRDNARLTVRIPARANNTDATAAPTRQPVRAIIDSQLVVSPDAALMAEPGQVVIYTVSTDQSKIERLEMRGARVCVLAPETATNGLIRVPLTAVFADLRAQSLHSVWVEAGASLSGALIMDRWVDEWIVYIAPKILGLSALGLLAMPELAQLDKADQFCVTELRQIGEDVRLRLRPIGQT